MTIADNHRKLVDFIEHVKDRRFPLVVMDYDADDDNDRTDFATDLTELHHNRSRISPDNNSIPKRTLEDSHARQVRTKFDWVFIEAKHSILELKALFMLRSLFLCLLVFSIALSLHVVRRTTPLLATRYSLRELKIGYLVPWTFWQTSQFASTTSNKRTTNVFAAASTL